MSPLQGSMNGNGAVEYLCGSFLFPIDNSVECWLRTWLLDGDAMIQSTGVAKGIATSLFIASGSFQFARSCHAMLYLSTQLPRSIRSPRSALNLPHPRHPIPMLRHRPPSPLWRRDDDHALVRRFRRGRMQELVWHDQHLPRRRYSALCACGGVGIEHAELVLISPFSICLFGIRVVVQRVADLDQDVI